MAVKTSPNEKPRPPWLHAALLLLILFAFARIAWNLGSEDLWWDESLTLQRAESRLLPLLKNEIVLADGRSTLTSTDQHPFFYFLAQAVLLRLAGDDEFVLRFVSASASTLMVPVSLVFAMLYVRRGVFPNTAPLWSALMAAVSPFLLWFGQEARPYALWALLALLSTYLILRATEQPRERDGRRLWAAGYAVTLAMFVATHYYAVLLLPVHAAVIYLAFRARSRILATIMAVGIMVAGLLLITVAFWYVVLRQAAGANFRHISWEILLPDLLNAFSLGLSVDIGRVLVLDLVFGFLALAAAMWALRSRATWAASGWTPVAMIAAPVAGILVGDYLHPVYMTARHLSLIAGPFIVLVGAGLSLAWLLRPWLAVSLAVVLVAASGYSTFNYFTNEEYAQAEFSRLAADLDDKLAPGDLVLIKSPFAWRIFSYYLPNATVNGMPDDNENIDVYGAPLLNQPWSERFAFLEEASTDRRRVWLLVSGTQAHMDLDERIEAWLEGNLFKVQETTYFSQSSLKSHLYLPQVPVFDEVPPTVQNPVEVAFGNRILLHGYNVGDRPGSAVGSAPDSTLALPLTLYWEAAAPTDRRYKYQVKLVEVLDDGAQRLISLVEQEPYAGAIPTIYWDPGKIVVDYTELPPAQWPRLSASEDADRYRLLLQVYDAETLEKLPVTSIGADTGLDTDGQANSGGISVTEDGTTIILPYQWQRTQQ